MRLVSLLISFALVHAQRAGASDSTLTALLAAKQAALRDWHGTA